MKHKVCYIATLPSTLESFVFKSAQYNMAHGDWDVTVICNTDEAFASRIPDGIRYIPVDMPRGMNLGGLKAIPRLYQIFRKEKFDLVQYATANAGLYASVAAKLARVPIRLYTLWGIGYVRLSGFRRFYKHTLEYVICKCSTHIQPDSRENLEIALKEKLFAPEQSEVIGYGSAIGIDFDRFDIRQKEDWNAEIRRTYSIPDNGFVLGYVGMMLKDKGVNELLDASKKLVDKYPDIYVMIVGSLEIKEGIDEKKYKWAEEHGRIIFTGKQRQVEKYYAAMDCFTLPSYHEGFGMVTIEAEAMGLPIVDTDIPGSREAMKDGVTGISIPVKDPKALADAVETLYLDSDLRDRYANAAYQYVKERFDQKQLLAKIFDNREKLMERKYG